MIRYRQGNIVEDTADALVNTVNCVGVMGRGVALAFKQAFPENFAAYVAACKRREVIPGRMFVTETGVLTNPRYIINFPTKRHWRSKSRYEDIEAGLDALIEVIRAKRIGSVAIPPLGCGLGGLHWARVRPMIERALARVPDVSAMVYEPGPTPDAAQARRQPPEMTQSRAVLVLALHRYLQAMLDPVVTLLEVHKLLYFAQCAGQNLRLRFSQGPYGPYAENLRFVLGTINHYYVETDMRGGDNPKAEVSLLPDALADAEANLRQDACAMERLNRVFRLVHGWESPHGLELLATVHWVAEFCGASDEEQAISQTYEWNPRKRQFTRGQIALAYRTLTEQGWIGVGEAG